MEAKEIFKIAESNKWYRQASNAKAYYLFAPSRGAIDSLGAPYGFWCIRDGIYFEFFCPEKYYFNRAKWALEQEKKDINWIDEKIKKCEVGMKNLNFFYKKHSAAHIAALGLDDVCKAIRDFEEIVFSFWKEIYVGDWFDPNGEQLLNKEIKKSKIDFDTYEVSVLLKTKKMHYAQKERLEFLKIALSIKNNKHSLSSDWVKNALTKHSEKYFYINNSWESTKVLTSADFMARLEEVLSLDLDEIVLQIKELKTNWESIHEDIYKKYRIKKELKNVFYLFRSVSYLRDVRKGFTLLSNHYFDLLYSRLAKLLSVPFEKLAITLPLDLVDNVSKKRLEGIAKERSRFMVEAYSKKKIKIFCGKVVNEIYSSFHKSFSGETDTIKGCTASPGKVKGVVRVVMGETHFGKFNDGEILVAPMTRPEYLPLMKKALAIITDEGGITSHAAIVARELKKPCIIGTKVATKVLRDGDLVEVNTNHNIIRILKK